MPFSKAAGGLFLAAAILAAYNAPTDTAGPLTAHIEAPAQISETGRPVPIKVTLSNAGSESLHGRVRLGVIDRWSASPAGLDFDLPANGSRDYAFTIIAAPGSYNALYPIHAYAEFSLNGTSFTAHPIFIVQPNFSEVPRASRSITWTPTAIAADSGFALWRTPVRRVVLEVFGRPVRIMPVGWEGTDPDTHAHAQFSISVNRGDMREAVNMHEPYAHGPGTILSEYPLALPESKPIKLTFANAVRDDTPGQPPGDGVTFRVRVLPFDAPEGKLGDIVFEHHTAAKTWQPGEADLSRYAGQRVRLQLESNPGPRNNTTNDSSYWAEPTILAGERKTGIISSSERSRGIDVVPGTRGLLDAWVQIHNGLSFHGFQVRVLGDELDDWHSVSVLTGWHVENANGRQRVRHSFRSWAGTFDLVGEWWIESNVLRVHWMLENAPAQKPWLAAYIESAGPGSWTQAAHRVYAGDGNVLQDPAAFSLNFDGHRLSTSFAGFDFADGSSLVEAVDVPPNLLEVDPKTCTYSLRAAHEQTMTFIPAGSVWDAAKTWHDIDGLHPADGVSKLAGRFVFDLWGGNYAASAAALAHAFHYGLTDAMVVWHNWQRWGYDYRLPDIFPPNPKMGSTEEFVALAAECKRNGVLFAPHDNYIDFYPDAPGFSYDDIAFNANGAPVKAWFNKGRDAQSYRWRADRLQPRMEANLHTIRDRVAPTAYFIDVWSSAGPYDYWTRDGAFHGRLETRKVWADTFTWIRNTLGDHAPQISESGHDQLIGALDGGQCNHLRVDTSQTGAANGMVWNIKAADAERIPWYDAAHHDRFVLHGAGYENRYAAGLDTTTHGIYSDDYISTEVLDGHPAMVPVPMGRDVVRKYWLLHDLMRTLALARFESHEFVGGNLHRQHVKWENGGDVWVNRGEDDWTVNGHTLPQYGFYARVPGLQGATEAAIERREGIVVEWSRSPEGAYSSVRPFVTDGLPVSVAVAGIDDLGNRQFRLRLNWTIAGTMPSGYRALVHALVHFTDASGNILFQGDHNPPAATGQTSVVVRVPESIVPGQHLEARVGLYDHSGRPKLIGLNDDQHRLRVAALEWTGSKVMWQPISSPAADHKVHPVVFDNLTTDGALRVTHQEGATMITPLPGGPAFEIRLKTAARTIEARGESGEVLGSIQPRIENGAVIFTRDPSVFRYVLR